jgi:hypothetical protein
MFFRYDFAEFQLAVLKDELQRAYPLRLKKKYTLPDFDISQANRSNSPEKAQPLSSQRINSTPTNTPKSQKKGTPKSQKKNTPKSQKKNTPKSAKRLR